MFRQIVYIRVRKLSNRHLVELRHIKRENASVSVDVQRPPKRLLLQLVRATKKSTLFPGFSRLCLTESPGRRELWERGCFTLKFKKFTFFNTFMTPMLVFSFIQFLFVSVKWKGSILFTSNYNYISTGYA